MKKQKSSFALGKQLTSKEMKRLQGGTLIFFPLFPMFFTDTAPMMPPPFVLTASSANT